MDRPVLAVRDLVVERDGIPIVRGVGFDIRASEVLAILGPNGSGKTSLLEAASGVVRPAAGSIALHGVDVTRESRRRRTRRGLRHVRQGRAVFAELTVEENLRAAGGDTDRAYEFFPELRERPGIRAGELSGGEQQMLVLARALIARPSCLLIDEISLGLAPLVVKRLTRVIKEAAQAGAAVLLVEQFTSVALGIADVVIVLVRGEIVLRERAEALVKDPTILERVYLGVDSRDAGE